MKQRAIRYMLIKFKITEYENIFLNFKHLSSKSRDSQSSIGLERLSMTSLLLSCHLSYFIILFQYNMSILITQGLLKIKENITCMNDTGKKIYFSN